MNQKEYIKKLQEHLNVFYGHKLTVDGDWGPKTQAAVDQYDIGVDFIVTPKPAEEPRKIVPWLLEALKYKGKVETDPAFNKEMSSKWKLVGLDLGTIATSWAAWCGLAVAVALSGVGLDYQKNGATAKNWDKFGVEIDWKTNGIPQGAIVRINSSGNCTSASGNHVSMANGYCTAKELLEGHKTIDLYGGNQGNTWKVSTYNASRICNVRWPKDYEMPGTVLKSVSCSSKSVKDESTR